MRNLNLLYYDFYLLNSLLFKWNCLSENSVANVPVKFFPLDEINLAAQQVLQVHQQSAEIKQAALRLHLHQEIDILVVTGLAAGR